MHMCQFSDSKNITVPLYFVVESYDSQRAVPAAFTQAHKLQLVTIER